MTGAIDEDLLVNNLIDTWQKCVNSVADPEGTQALMGELRIAESQLLSLVPKTSSAAQAKLLLMNNMASDGDAGDEYDGGRTAFAEERARIVELLISTGTMTPLLRYYLPDL